MSTIFSKIISREIPAEIIYEDDLTLVFLDIKPVNPGHALVIPKQAFENIFDGDPETLGYMMQVAQRVGQAMMRAGLAEGVNLIMNNGIAAGQEVWHAHIHVIPRRDMDNVLPKPNHTEVIPEAMKELASTLAKAMD